MVDTLTGDRFNNDDRSTLRIKCLLLSLTVPVIYTILALIDILDKLFVFINKIGNLIVHLIAYYLHGIYQEDADPIMKQVVDLIKLPVQVVLAPVCVVLLELATLYGLVCPYNGRKLFANLERFRYGAAALVACFQPTAFGEQVADLETTFDLCGALAETTMNISIF